jgi:hypothetical protein
LRVTTEFLPAWDKFLPVSVQNCFKKLVENAVLSDF